MNQITRILFFINKTISLYIYKKRGCPWENVRGILCKEQKAEKKTFASIVFHLFTWGFSSHLSEKKGSLQKSGLSQARASSFYSSCRAPHLINRIEEWGKPRMRSGKILFRNTDTYPVFFRHAVRLYGISFEIGNDSACRNAFGFQCIGNVLRTFFR